MGALRFDKLAFIGGDFIAQLGPVEDVICFFALVEEFAASSLDEGGGRQLLLDRLYKRYVRIEETPKAIEAMEIVRRRFASVETSSINWQSKGFGARPTSLKLEGANLSEVTARYFAAFSKCALAAVYYATEAEHRMFRPVKISRSDFGSLDREQNRPLEMYESLEGPPFWLGGN